MVTDLNRDYDGWMQLRGCASTLDCSVQLGI